MNSQKWHTARDIKKCTPTSKARIQAYILNLMFFLLQNNRISHRGHEVGSIHSLWRIFLDVLYKRKGHVNCLDVTLSLLVHDCIFVMCYNAKALVISACAVGQTLLVSSGMSA